MVQGFGYHLEHAGHFFADFSGSDARLIGSFHHLVRKVADYNWIVGRGFRQLFCHPSIEKIDPACAHLSSSSISSLSSTLFRRRLQPLLPQSRSLCLPSLSLRIKHQPAFPIRSINLFAVYFPTFHDSLLGLTGQKGLTYEMVPEDIFCRYPHLLLRETGTFAIELQKQRRS